MTSLQPLLKEGSYRRYCGVPGRRSRQSCPPYCPEIAPELFPPRLDFSRQRGHASALRLRALLKDALEGSRLQIPGQQSGEQVGRFAGNRAVSPDHPDSHDPLACDQLQWSRPDAQGPHGGPVEGHGPHDTGVQPTAGGVWPTEVGQESPEGARCPIQFRSQTQEVLPEVPPAVEDESQVLHRPQDAEGNMELGIELNKQE